MKRITLIITLLLAINYLGYGQLNPFSSMYFQNQYLLNPAMAGVAKGWELNTSFKVQWTNIDQAPSMQALTAAYGAENKNFGFGFTLVNDKAGVVQQTTLKITYAYHLPLDDEKRLDFGLSAGAMDEWVDFKKIRGEVNDQALSDFNARGLLFDGDFGLTYRSKHLTLQGVVPNLNRYAKKNNQAVADRFSYMAACSYLFKNEGAILKSVEPKLTYRSVENYDDIVDVGANFLLFDNKLIVNGTYRSTNSLIIGAGTTYKERLTLLTLFTSNTSALGNYGNGEFEIALKYNFK